MKSNRTEQELCLVLDALGADGAAEYRSGASAEQLRQNIFTHVRWLELRARNEGREEAAADFERLATIADVSAQQAPNLKVRLEFAEEAENMRAHATRIRAMKEKDE